MKTHISYRVFVFLNLYGNMLYMHIIINDNDGNIATQDAKEQ